MFLATWPSFLPVSSSRTERRIGRRGQPASDGRHRFPGAVLSSIFRQKRGAQHPLWTLCSVPSLWQQGFKRLFSQSLQNGMGKVYMLKHGQPIRSSGKIALLDFVAVQMLIYQKVVTFVSEKMGSVACATWYALPKADRKAVMLVSFFIRLPPSDSLHTGIGCYAWPFTIFA